MTICGYLRCKSIRAEKKKRDMTQITESVLDTIKELSTVES